MKTSHASRPAGDPRSRARRLISLIPLVASVTVPLTINAAASESVWVGDPSGNGNWSAVEKWDPDGVPNGSGVSVTVPFNSDPYYFNGPRLDVDTVLNNLTMGNRAYIHNQTGDNGQQGNLTVNGTTELQVGSPGQYGAIAVYNQKTYTLGTLTNYLAATKTLASGNFSVAGATMRWHGADIVTNEATIFMGGATAVIQNQDNSADALTDFAVNNGVFQIEDGYNFTTSGDFTNNFELSIGGYYASNETIMTVTGVLTNYNAATRTLSGGSYTLEGSGYSAATLRFSGADIEVLDSATINFSGDAHITDLSGVDGFQYFATLQNSTFTSTNGQSHTPESGVFSNTSSTHNIDSGATATVDGSYAGSNGSLNIAAPTDTADTHFIITGNAVFENSGLDFGGQPGVNTQYHSTLQVMNGIEFRGAYITGTGTTYADIALIQGSRISPGHSTGELDFEGALQMDSDTIVEMQLGGLVPATEFDVIAHHGPADVTLGGKLELSFTEGFENGIKNTDTFEILVSDSNLLGAFSNVANGGHLLTSDGLGSLKVEYGGSKVILSDYLPFEISSIVVLPNGHIALHGLGVPGTINRLETSEDLVPAHFTTLVAMSLDETGSFDVEDTATAGKPQKFYRLAFP